MNALGVYVFLRPEFTCSQKASKHGKRPAIKAEGHDVWKNEAGDQNQMENVCIDVKIPTQCNIQPENSKHAGNQRSIVTNAMII